MTDRTQGIIDRLAGAESYDDIKWILKSGVLTNYTESVVDAKIKANYEFQGRAGLWPSVERIAVGKTCEWCQSVAGKYEGPQVPRDVWRRHDRCNCIIKYTAATGRVDTMRGGGSTWYIVDSTNPAAVANRANYFPISAPVTPPPAATVAAVTPQTIAAATNPVSSGAELAHVPKRKVTKHKQPLSEEEIIKRVAGGDDTKGSCMSAALTYTGNKGGYDVLDFRGGKSQDYFSLNTTVRKFTQLPDVKAWEVLNIDDYKGAEELMAKAETGKEYIMAVGSHAAVIKKGPDGYFRYLELQHPNPAGNGWQLFITTTLRDRFGCEKPFPGMMNPPQRPNFLIDVESLADSDELGDILPYTQTGVKGQKKSEGGSVK